MSIFLVYANVEKPLKNHPSWQASPRFHVVDGRFLEKRNFRFIKIK